MVVCSCLGLKPDTQRKTLWLMLGSLLLSCVFVVIKERHFAREIHRLSPVLTHLVPASCVPSPQNDGVYVHLECPIRNSSTFYPPDNFSKNINPFHGVFFEVKAEMYQYPSFPDFLGRRNPIWADHLVPGSAWSLFDGLRNPDFFPHVPGIGRQLASGLKAGGFSLPGEFASYFRTKQQLPLQDDGVYKQQQERPPRKLNSETTLVYNNFLYSGNPLKPQIGDIRISFWANANSHISLIAKQINKPFFGSPRAVLATAAAAPAVASNEGAFITIAAEGDYEPQRLVERHLKDLGFPSSFVWCWRLAAFCFFFLLFVSVDKCQPQSTHPTQAPFPFWTRVVLAALAAAAATFLLLAAAWWGVEAAAGRRLAVAAAAVAAAAVVFRLVLPRLLPATPQVEQNSSGGKYYDLGICLQVPSGMSAAAGAGGAAAAADSQAAAAPEHKQGTVIRWTTTPALGPLLQDTIRKCPGIAAASPGSAAASPATVTSTTAAASSDASSVYGAAYKKSAAVGVYAQQPFLQTRAGSLTNISPHIAPQKSASQGSI